MIDINLIKNAQSGIKINPGFNITINKVFIVKPYTKKPNSFWMEKNKYIDGANRKGKCRLY